MTTLTEDDLNLFTRFKIRAMGDKLRQCALSSWCLRFVQCFSAV
ncbi:hypothetical protein BMYO_2146 [Bifidobacterium myosotis]|uniref:Uncharacterized protein n=1 Tax=Bifidobacterium myosotis TaxID=1630166 RepID=A0A261FCP5_9BIFI|nr:hypothetical protein BMYO_2146 [Bifidobacterium myosotis]